jgi:DNA-directed RNA polymerase I subunit RPA2
MASSPTPAPRLERAGAHAHSSVLGADGLPHVGAVVWPGDPTYSEVDRVSGRYKAHMLKGEEVAVVESVTLIGGGPSSGGGGAGKRGRGGTRALGGGGPTRANIKLRFNRNPVIGDKFSSRHGQKGVLSVLWPDADMPYAASSGIRPDVLINPHAFPSRMTIGMLVESMAAKSGSLQGRFVDSSPFQRCDEEDDEESSSDEEEEVAEGKTSSKKAERRRRRLEGRDPVRAFGEALEGAGYSYFGQETMISGVTGEEMPCDIFMGVVYYQRLRHMVSDKFQVRSYGPVNALTRQPIKGRKFGGGIRFGEMERDALLAHGAAYLLHDRLNACSDYSVLDACARCGSLLAPSLERPAAASAAMGPAAAAFGSVGGGGAAGARVTCRLCGAGGAADEDAVAGGGEAAKGKGGGGKGGNSANGNNASIERVAVPYVFKYLAAELAAMGIKVSVGVSERLARR